VDVGLGVGEGVGFCVVDGVALAVGGALAWGAEPPLLAPGRRARMIATSTSTTTSAMNEGADALLVDRFILLIVIRESSLASPEPTTEVRPKHGYDNRRSPTRRVGRRGRTLGR
jgi:hypothetical protein